MDQTKINFSDSQAIILIGQIEPEFLQKSFGVSDQDFCIIDDDYSMARIKELLHFVFLKPYNSTKKLAVIYNIENLGSQVANALLKTLEEPPPYAVIILTTLDEQKILPTILSRCSKIKLDFAADLTEPENYLSPDILAKKSVAEKFKWAAVISESGDAAQMILLWQNYYREKLLSGEDVLTQLKSLSSARDLLQTNISVKLLLENILLEF